MRKVEDVLDDPLGCREEIMAAYMQDLEDCGMTIYREPKKVNRRLLDFGISTGSEWEE